MNDYEVVFTAKASNETIGLPPHAFKALIETLASVRADPWVRTEAQSPDDPAYRWSMFGEDGMLLAYVDDAAAVVRVYGLTWLE